MTLDEQVERLISTKSIELPTYPGVALKVHALISRPDFEVDDLARLVQSDQGLATQTMRAANSAFYRAAAPVKDLRAAITRIGAAQLGNIAFAGTLGLTASAAGPLAALRRDAFRASLVTALVAQALARLREQNEGEAFLAGLLHDFGQTVAYACFEVVLEDHPGEARPLDAWVAAGQQFQRALGLTLADEWHLPSFVAACVRDYASPAEAVVFARLVALVGTAHQVSRELLRTSSVEQTLGEVAHLADAERHALEALLPRVPSLLEAFDAAGPVPQLDVGLVAPPPVPRPAAPSSSAPTALDLEVEVLANGGRQPFRARGWGPTAMVMEAGAPVEAPRHAARRRPPVLRHRGGLRARGDALAGRGQAVRDEPRGRRRLVPARARRLTACSVVHGRAVYFHSARAGSRREMWWRGGCSAARHANR